MGSFYRVRVPLDFLLSYPQVNEKCCKRIYHFVFCSRLKKNKKNVISFRNFCVLFFFTEFFAGIANVTRIIQEQWNSRNKRFFFYFVGDHYEEFKLF